MAEAAVPVEVLTVELHGVQHPFPTLSFPDRRGRKPWRVKSWCLMRGIERVLYHVGDSSRSTGAFASHMDAYSQGWLVAERSAEKDGTITDEELTAGE
jgi:hypothetical protein